MITRENGLCRSCYIKACQISSGKRKADNGKRRKDTEARKSKYRKKSVVEICDKSPNQRHHDIMDGYIGECKYCGRIKDYKPLLARYIDV